MIPDTRNINFSGGRQIYVGEEIRGIGENVGDVKIIKMGQGDLSMDIGDATIQKIR